MASSRLVKAPLWKKVSADLMEEIHNGVFASGFPGEVELADQGSMVRAHDAMVTSVRNQVATRRWFTSSPSAAGAGFGCSGVLMLGFVWFFFGGSLDLALWLALPLIPVVLTSMVVRSRMRRGQR